MQDIMSVVLYLLKRYSADYLIVITGDAPKFRFTNVYSSKTKCESCVHV